MASLALLIMELSARWMSYDMDGTDASHYVVVDAFIFTTLLYSGLTFVAYKGHLCFIGLVLKNDQRRSENSQQNNQQNESENKSDSSEVSH